MSAALKAPAAISLSGLGLTVRPHFWSRPRALLDGINLEVCSGQMCALLGANGAGKTTLIRLLLGLGRATRGQGSVLGRPLGDVQARAGLGFVAERPALPLDFTPMEFVSLAARLAGRREGPALAQRAIARLGMGMHAHQRMRTFSKGMLQRIGLAQAIVGEPALLILDEPLSGLDPPARRDVRRLLTEERARGAAILFATHILADVVVGCDQAVVLVAGRLRHSGSPTELLGKAVLENGSRADDGDVEIGLRNLSPKAEAELATPIKRAIHFGNECRLTVAGIEAANQLLVALKDTEATVLSFEQDARALEALLVNSEEAG